MLIEHPCHKSNIAIREETESIYQVAQNLNLTEKHVNAALELSTAFLS